VELLDCWKGVRRVFLVDAVVSGLAPGIVHRLEPLGAPLPVDLFRCSTHAFGIAETIELARALDMLPRELVLFGIEGARFEPGSSLSPEVEVAAADVARRIAAEAATDA
jgi:hydrogenase maturation protease